MTYLYGLDLGTKTIIWNLNKDFDRVSTTFSVILDNNNNKKKLKFKCMNSYGQVWLQIIGYMFS